MPRMAFLWCSGVGARGHPVWGCVVRAWSAWSRGWRLGSRGGGAASCVGLLLCAILFCPLMDLLSLHGAGACGGRSVWSGGWGTMRTGVTRRSIFQPGGSRGGLGCLVFGWCCSSAVRCLHCAGVCFSLVGVLCGLTRSAISGTAVDTHLRLVMLASGVERGALGAVCIVLSELYPAPTVISAEYPLCGRSVNELGPGMSGSAVLPGPGSCVNSGSSSLYMYGVLLLTGSSALIGVVVRCPLRRSSFEGMFFPSLIWEAAGNIMCRLRQWFHVKT